jgi:hypothetical protein
VTDHAAALKHRPDSFLIRDGSARQALQQDLVGYGESNIDRLGPGSASRQDRNYQQDHGCDNQVSDTKSVFYSHLSTNLAN